MKCLKNKVNSAALLNDLNVYDEYVRVFIICH